MDLRYIAWKCPVCGRVWGRTEEYSQDSHFDDVEEVKEYRLCPACRNRRKTSAKNPGLFKLRAPERIEREYED